MLVVKKGVSCVKTSIYWQTELDAMQSECTIFLVLDDGKGQIVEEVVIIETVYTKLYT